MLTICPSKNEENGKLFWISLFHDKKKASIPETIKEN
jgi:hypothetical protein